MEIVLATLQLDRPGGVETYLLTIAPQLERLGHQVTLYSPALGAIAELALSRGLRVVGSELQLPGACDAVVSNDGVSALSMAERYPDAVRVIVVHGADFDLHLPPLHDGVVSCAIAMNGVVQRRLAATASDAQVVRLRQPIELARFCSRQPIDERPRRVLVLSNYLNGERRRELIESCERAGLRCRQVGIERPRLNPVEEINEADVVIGQGRAVLEAMACGRAAWVFGPSGGDGWVTEASYPLLEDDGFRARGTDAIYSGGAIASGLEHYRPAMGDVNRALVVRHHSAYDHVAALATLLRRDRAKPAAPGPLREMARLVRTQFDAQARIDDVLAELREARREIAALKKELGRQTDRANAILATRRWRAVNRAAWPIEKARSMRRGS